MRGSAGDVAVSSHYGPDKCVRWKDLHLRLDGARGPTIANLRLTVTLRYCKGSKDVQHEDRIVHFEPLMGTDNAFADPILYILIHALRNALVKGSSIDDVLQRAHERGGTIQWTLPDYPLLPAIHQHAHATLVLNRPAHTQQVLDSLCKMSQLADLSEEFTTGSLRRGAARDVAHLPPSSIRGVATFEIA
ncbi:hypothetical protein MBLNU457_2332t1 [Dothideomycetes sp. NU457]